MNTENKTSDKHQNSNALIADVGKRFSVDDIKNGKAYIDMRGSEKWGKKVERLRQILRVAAPKKLRQPAYTFAPFYYCKDGYWYESNWRKSDSVPVFRYS